MLHPYDLTDVRMAFHYFSLLYFYYLMIQLNDIKFELLFIVSQVCVDDCTQLSPENKRALNCVVGSF